MASVDQILWDSTCKRHDTRRLDWKTLGQSIPQADDDECTHPHVPPCNVDPSDKTHCNRNMDPISMERLVNKHVFVLSGDKTVRICYNPATLKSDAEHVGYWRNPPDFRETMKEYLRKQIVKLMGVHYMTLNNQVPDLEAESPTQQGLWGPLMEQFVGPVSQLQVYVCPVCYARAAKGEQNTGLQEDDDPLFVLMTVTMPVVKKFVFRRVADFKKHLIDGHSIVYDKEMFPDCYLKSQIYAWLQTQVDTGKNLDYQKLRKRIEIYDHETKQMKCIYSMGEVDIKMYWKANEMCNRVFYNALIGALETDDGTLETDDGTLETDDGALETDDDFDNPFAGDLNEERDGEMNEARWAARGEYVDDIDDFVAYSEESSESDQEKECVVKPRKRRVVLSDSDDESQPKRRRRVVESQESGGITHVTARRGKVVDSSDDDDEPQSPQGRLTKTVKRRSNRPVSVKPYEEGLQELKKKISGDDYEEKVEDELCEWNPLIEPPSTDSEGN